MPEWMDPIRIVAVFLIWLTFAVVLWLLYRQHKQHADWLKQHRAWVEAEHVRMIRWKTDMDAASKMREEAYHLRAQAEVALAQARQQALRNHRHD
jgi:DNA relaxase NicK